MEYHEIRERLGARRFRNVMHISRTFNYVYVANPKAACSTLKLVLSKAESNDPDFTPESLHNRKHLPLLTPNKLSSKEQGALFDGSYYLFSFVRHPFKRALSAYTDKISCMIEAGQLLANCTELKSMKLGESALRDIKILEDGLQLID